MARPTDAGFGVYVHWPFCASKCPYCDFNSHVRHGGVDEARFVAALERELATLAALQEHRPVSSVFFGGGTPSLLSPSGIGRLIEAIGRLWPLPAEAEITLEANPSSVEAGRFAGYRSVGVNRVSLGVQALNDADLRALGRLHTLAEALTAMETARNTFARTSFDLIYARPGQDEAAWDRELGRALDFGPSHLSLYQLTIEEGTPFAALHRSGRLPTPPAEQAAALYALTQERTEAAGLPAYEISNHARPGEECRHNFVYWRYGDYVGAGPGAHGRPRLGELRRATATERSPERWLALVERQGHGCLEIEPLELRQQADETLLMGLRLSEGLDLGRLAALTGLAPAPQTLGVLQAEGLVELPTADRLRATPAGRPVLNRLVLALSEALEPVGGRRTATGDGAPVPLSRAVSG